MTWWQWLLVYLGASFVLTHALGLLIEWVKRRG